MATVKHLPDIIRYGEVVAKGVEEYHASNSDLKYTYIQHPITVDGQQMYVVVDIRQSRQKDMFWVHGVYVDKKISQILDASAENPGQTIKKDLTDEKMLTQNDPDVKGKFSLSDSKGRQLSKEQQETDNAYLDAVNRGDTETAQKMVDDAAKAAGYTDEVYHGTSADFTVFNSGYGQYGPGVYFTNDKRIAGGYGSAVKHLYVKIGKVADYDDAYITM